ncbi:hypothetical protein LPJ70_003475, partial [Coemansia sp. RSA 2708]
RPRLLPGGHPDLARRPRRPRADRGLPRFARALAGPHRARSLCGAGRPLRRRPPRRPLCAGAREPRRAPLPHRPGLRPAHRRRRLDVLRAAAAGDASAAARLHLRRHAALGARAPGPPPGPPPQPCAPPPMVPRQLPQARLGAARQARRRRPGPARALRLLALQVRNRDPRQHPVLQPVVLPRHLGARQLRPKRSRRPLCRLVRRRPGQAAQAAAAV